MGKKTGQKSQILLRLDKEPKLLEIFEKVKGKIGIQSNADLVRMLINEKYEALKTLGPLLPRFEQINSDENGVKILDREIRKVVDVHFKPSGITCTFDQTSDCEHVRFALAQRDIQTIIKKKKKEGWKLPDV